MEHVPGKSINLAMSVRGLTGLRMVRGSHGDHSNLGDHVVHDYGIPMFARMIHNLDGSTYPVPYGTKEQCILSVGRRSDCSVEVNFALGTFCRVQLSIQDFNLAKWEPEYKKQLMVSFI